MLEFLVQEAAVWNVKLGSTRAARVSTAVMFQIFLFFRGVVKFIPLGTSATI
jgi:hypothetical protein